MPVRSPVVAGRFYPSDPRRCRSELESCLPPTHDQPAIEGAVVGGVGPHAGWICSGAIAARVAAACARQGPRSAILFGAVHVPHVERPSLYARGSWQTPLGTVDIDEPLAERIAAESSLIRVDDTAHRYEHSIEVHLPFLQHYLAPLRIVPIMVPPDDDAAAVGDEVGRVARAAGGPVFVLGSSDLTHYGPAYEFTPYGVGMAGLRWAKQENDRRMIDLILRLDATAVVPEARAHGNACGSGAIAATIAACKQLGADRAVLLDHATSFEVLSARFPEEPTDAVGYAGIVFVRSAA